MFSIKQVLKVNHPPPEPDLRKMILESNSQSHTVYALCWYFVTLSCDHAGAASCLPTDKRGLLGDVLDVEPHNGRVTEQIKFVARKTFHVEGTRIISFDPIMTPAIRFTGPLSTQTQREPTGISIGEGVFG